MDEEKTLFEIHMEDTWETLAKLTGLSNPLFDHTLFLMGYEFTSNSYLLQGDYHSIIDPGNDYSAFMQLLELGITPPTIKKVALTHGHHDHAMGVLELFRGYGGYDKKDLEIIMHEAGPEEFKRMVRELGCRISEVKGGEIINLSGFDLEVIHTPGHTIDGLCFYHPPSRTVFTGDTVLPLAMADVDQKAGGRLDHYFYALRTLLRREVDHVLPGHGGMAINLGRRVMEETYDALIKKEVGIETPLMDGAAQLAQQGLLEEALFYVNKELDKDADSLRAMEFKAFLLNDLGRVEEALAWFDRLLAQNSGHFPALMGKGAALLGLGRYEESLPYFDDVLKAQPQSKEAQVSKGMALYLAGRPEEALDIEAFRTEFTRRMKDEMERLAQQKT